MNKCEVCGRYVESDLGIYYDNNQVGYNACEDCRGMWDGELSSIVQIRLLHVLEDLGEILSRIQKT